MQLIAGLLCLGFLVIFCPAAAQTVFWFVLGAAVMTIITAYNIGD